MRRIEFTIQTQNYCSGKSLGRAFNSLAIKVGWTGGRLRTVFSLLCLMLLMNWGQTALAQCALVCNDDVNVSLPGTNANCEVEITVDMVLEDPQSCNSPFEVDDHEHCKGSSQSPLPRTVNETHVGETFIYSVFELNSGNSCWGTITVEDKLGPNLIADCDDLFIPCVI